MEEKSHHGLLILGAILILCGIMFIIFTGFEVRLLVSFGGGVVAGGLFIGAIYFPWKREWQAAAGIYGAEEKDRIWAKKAETDQRWGWLIGCSSLLGSMSVCMIGSTILGRSEGAGDLAMIAGWGAITGLFFELWILWSWLYSITAKRAKTNSLSEK